MGLCTAFKTQDIPVLKLETGEIADSCSCRVQLVRFTHEYLLVGTRLTTVQGSDTLAAHL